MMLQANQIFRAFARGESVNQIAGTCGLTYAQTWLLLRRAVAEMERKKPATLDNIRWQQYLVLMRIVDQAFAAFERSAEDSVNEATSDD